MGQSDDISVLEREARLRLEIEDRDRRVSEAEARLELTEKKRQRMLRQVRIAGITLAVLLLPITLVALGARAIVQRSKRTQARKARRAGAPETISDHLKATPPAPARPADPAAAAAADARADDFMLVRVVGNDLVPRHSPGQTRVNLAFILAHEPELADCRKAFLVNRIVDPDEEARIVALLDAHQADYRVLPFDRAGYAATGFDFSDFAEGFFGARAFRDLSAYDRDLAVTHSYRLKNNAVMNNNGARNAALDWAREQAKWALPWDGNCFVTADAWAEIRAAVQSHRDRLYFATPMARVTDNAVLLDLTGRIEAQEEPQLIFRVDAPERFDEAHPYGRRPKVELLCRLGVPGPWDEFPLKPWDKRPQPRVPGVEVGEAGWVARLFSGVAEAEAPTRASFDRRGVHRNLAILAMLNRLDAKAMAAAGFEAERPVYYDPTLLAAAGPTWRAGLEAVAKAALDRGPFSVTHKTTLPPSGDRHDYWHPAPYFWPNPDTEDGLPYVQRDGERVPGTELYEPEAERYDRTRLQRLFDDTTALALTAHLTGAEAYAEAARARIRAWFIDPAARMTPHLTFSQVRMGRDGNRGSPSGLIEFKDLYFLLDAVRMLGPAPELAGLRGWLSAYGHWLRDSRQGSNEVVARNNHGTAFDLQLAAIAAFTGDTDTLLTCRHRALSRLTGQITADGAQPHEMTRTLTQHYGAFNLQCWLNLFAVLEGCALDPWSAPEADRLRAGLDTYLAESAAGWAREQIKPFDSRRLAPLCAAARRCGATVPAQYAKLGLEGAAGAPLILDPHDGVSPFWEVSRIAPAPQAQAATGGV